MVKKGDTLVEVTIAIGIFSLIAIAVASVMSGGTASAQLALETTLAREEIDTQADAIRFIHANYTANKDNNDHPYVQLWRRLTNNAIDILDFGEGEEKKVASILQYTPPSCSELYDNQLILNSAFVINPRQFNKLTDNIGTTNFDVSPVFYPYDESMFIPASTYPRLIFGSDTANLADNSFPDNLTSVEGIYVVPVVDPQSTRIVDVIEEEDVIDKSAYYDFYIRTCWYGSRTDDPSTISTVIRLHDPDAVFVGGLFDVKFSGFDSNYYKNNEIENKQNIRKMKLPEAYKYGYVFKGWKDIGNPSGQIYPKKTNLINSGSSHKVYNLEAVFEEIVYKFQYDPSGGLQGGSVEGLIPYNQSNPTTTECYLNRGNCVLTNKVPIQSGWNFQGWCLGEIKADHTCDGKLYPAGGTIDKDTLKTSIGTNQEKYTTVLKAVWGKYNDHITIKLSWDYQNDYDSYISGTNSHNVEFIAYFGKKKPTENVEGETIVLAELDRDCTSSCSAPRDETFTINTLGGKDYYYYVKDYSHQSNSDCDFKNVKVEFTSSRLPARTFTATNASGNSTLSGAGCTWNVFALKNGQLVTPNNTANGVKSNYSIPLKY